MRHSTPNRHPVRWLWAAGAAAAAFAAQAGDADPARDGVMTFPHVRVTKAPAAERASAQAPAADGRAGFRAYIDPATGKLTQPTAEQAAALEAAAASAAPPARLPQSQPLYGPGGAVGMTLDDAQMMNYVVRRGAHGALDTACVPGDEVAHTLARPVAAVKPARKEETK